MTLPEDRLSSSTAENQDTLKPSMSGALQSRNVRIHNRRTSVRLEPAMWGALNEIATLEKCSIHDLCGAVYDLKEKDISFTAALRVFMMEYYRSALRTDGQESPIRKKLKDRKPDA